MSGRFKRAVAGVVACALVGGVALLVALPGATAADSDHWASGVYPGPCKNINDQSRVDYVNQLRSFGTWRNHPVELTMQFAPYTGTTNWLTNEEPNSLFKCAVYVRQQLRVPMIFAVPMLPQFDTEDPTNTTAGNPTLKAGAAGDYNVYWRTLAHNLVDRGLGDTTLRIGWELNGNWFRWSAYQDPVSWVAYWRQIVNTMRSVSPALKFDYSVALGSTYANPFGTSPTSSPPGVYPGDQYVDIVSASLYDQWYGQTACTPTSQPDGCKSASARWTYLTGQRYGLTELSKFAKAHQKPLGFSEWALASTGSFAGGGGGDDVYFMQSFHAWLVAASANLSGGRGVAYEVYFDKDHLPNVQAMTDGAGTDSKNFPLAQSRYKTYWAAPTHSASTTVLPSGVTPTAPSSSPPPSSSSPPSSSPPPSSSSPSPTPSTTPPPVLPKNTPLFSKYSSRAKAKKLSKQKVSGYIYVFVKPSKAVSYAAWYLDDSKRKKKAYRLVRITPYDLVGYKGRVALPFQVGHVKKGKHTLSVLLRWKTGGYKVYTVTFTR